MPFAKESPFVEPIKKTLMQLKSSGVIDLIWRDHQIVTDSECDEKKVKTKKLT